MFTKLPQSSRAHTIVEMMVTVACFFVIMAVAGAIFSEAMSVSRFVSGGDRAQREMRRARAQLERDLILTNSSQIGRSRMPDYLGGGGDTGESLWFLSPVDPVSGQTVLRQDGKPCWQRNILYYITIPLNHDQIFGVHCQGGMGANGFDDRCPHKVLVRRVIDSGPPTVDEATQETLLPGAAIGPYLVRPTNLQVPQGKLVASGLLHFSTISAPAPASIPTELFVDMRSLSLEEAQRHAQVGITSFFGTRFESRSPFSVFLRN